MSDDIFRHTYNLGTGDTKATLQIEGTISEFDVLCGFNDLKELRKNQFEKRQDPPTYFDDISDLKFHDFSIFLDDSNSVDDNKNILNSMKLEKLFALMRARLNILSLLVDDKPIEKQDVCHGEAEVRLLKAIYDDLEVMEDIAYRYKLILRKHNVDAVLNLFGYDD